MLITLEGGEGCGKSTHLWLLSEWLDRRGVAHILTREPGGTTIGAHISTIRTLLLNRQAEGIDPVSELFLYLADRRQHVAKMLGPALKAQKIVLCDRYTDSTLAYQGYGRGLDLDMLRGLNEVATEGLKPDLTLLFDCDWVVGLARAWDRADKLEAGTQREDRFESEEIDFHRRVRQGYLALAAAEPERFRIIDAARPIEDVQADVRRVVGHALGLKP